MIRQTILDYDGVFTNDDYTAILDALRESSGLEKSEIEKRCGELERAYVLSPDSKKFLEVIRDEFRFPGTIWEIAELLNERGDSGLYDEFHRFLSWKSNENGTRGLSILSNQIAYRVPYVRSELSRRIGLEHFDRVWFSPEIGLQKPFVGFTKDADSSMNTEGINIFPVAVSQMRYLGYNPEECVFIDDSIKNIKSSMDAGFNGIVFKSIEQTLKELREKYQVKI